eukprot:6034564-Karenia_brevis.AAC.1
MPFEEEIGNVPGPPSIREIVHGEDRSVGLEGNRERAAVLTPRKGVHHVPEPPPDPRKGDGTNLDFELDELASTLH